MKFLICKLYQGIFWIGFSDSLSLKYFEPMSFNTVVKKSHGYSFYSAKTEAIWILNEMTAWTHSQILKLNGRLNFLPTPFKRKRSLIVWSGSLLVLAENITLDVLKNVNLQFHWLSHLFAFQDKCLYRSLIRYVLYNISYFSCLHSSKLQADILHCH